MKKKLLKYAAVMVDMLCIVMALMYGYILLAAVLLVPLVFVYINRIVKRKLSAQKYCFSPYSEVRNVDGLVIGDMVNPQSLGVKGRYVQISAPNRGLMSSFEILKHTSSILKDKGGEVIIACKRNAPSRFSIFDVQWFHPITIKKYNLYRLAKKAAYPMIYAPIDSVKIAYNIPNKLSIKQLPPQY